MQGFDPKLFEVELGFPKTGPSLFSGDKLPVHHFLFKIGRRKFGFNVTWLRSNPALSGTGFGPLSHRIDQVSGGHFREDHSFAWCISIISNLGHCNPSVPI